MKCNITIEELAAAMIANSDHSDITADHRAVDYRVEIAEDGTIGAGYELTVRAEIDPAIIPSSGEDAAVLAFLDAFDDAEDLKNEYFRDAAEEMLQLAREYVESL